MDEILSAKSSEMCMFLQQMAADESRNFTMLIPYYWDVSAGMLDI